MNKGVLFGIIIGAVIIIGIVTTITIEDSPILQSETIGNQDEDVSEVVGRNLKIELREGIGVENTP